MDIGKFRHWIRLSRLSGADVAGGDNNLIVSLRSYTPGVRCIPSVSGYPRLDNCGAILNEMEVSKEITTFGDAATSGVDVRTPYTIHERKSWPHLHMNAVPVQD